LRVNWYARGHSMSVEAGVVLTGYGELGGLRVAGAAPGHQAATSASQARSIV